jgi:hypothetical protein
LFQKNEKQEKKRKDVKKTGERFEFLYFSKHLLLHMNFFFIITSIPKSARSVIKINISGYCFFKKIFKFSNEFGFVFSFPQKNELARLCYALMCFPLSIHTVIYVGGKLILQIEYEATFRFCLQEKNYTQHTHTQMLVIQGLSLTVNRRLITVFYFLFLFCVYLFRKG